MVTGYGTTRGSASATGRNAKQGHLTSSRGRIESHAHLRSRRFPYRQKRNPFKQIVKPPSNTRRHRRPAPPVGFGSRPAIWAMATGGRRIARSVTPFLGDRQPAGGPPAGGRISALYSECDARAAEFDTKFAKIAGTSLTVSRSGLDPGHRRDKSITRPISVWVQLCPGCAAPRI